jgi:hypothetical protein
MPGVKRPARPLRRRPARGWVAALLAAWALALLPTLAQALAHAGGGTHWAQVCTAQGARWVALDATPAPETPTQAPVCTWCLTTPFALPPPSAALPADARGGALGVGPAAADAPLRLVAWRAPPPRAPPPALV